MDRSDQRLTVLQGKFAAYLSWSQPFIHQLISALGEHVTNVVVCNRAENLDRFPTENIVRFKTRYLVNPTFSMLASSYLLKAWKPQVMHAHFGWSGIRMLLLRQFLRVPLVVSFGGRDAGVQMHMPHFDRLYQVLLDASDQIICVSEDLKSQLVEHGVAEDRIAVIRRGTNLRRFNFVDRSDRDPAAAVKLLMVGRCVEKKGHQYVFEALSQLAGKEASVHLTIVGEGEQYHLLRKLRNSLRLRDVVEFAGVTDHEGVRRHSRPTSFCTARSPAPTGTARAFPTWWSRRRRRAFPSSARGTAGSSNRSTMRKTACSWVSATCPRWARRCGD